MTTTPHIALMQAQDLPAAAAGEVPEWIHLLPAGAEVMTADGRGPYRVVDPQAVVEAAGATPRLPVDENHAIDWAAPRGEPSPARGWIVALQARPDGIWGRVDWTAAGRALTADRAYIGVSPAIVHDGSKRILAIARASLTNKPNLRGLTALHTETSMSLTAIAKALGLAEDATEEQILAAIAAHSKPADTALQAQMGEIGIALGAPRDATPEAILAAARAKGAAAPAEIVALQTELARVAGELATIRDARTRAAAETFVDAAIREGRVGVKPVRDRFITMHMADPEGTEAIVRALPALGAGRAPAMPPPAQTGDVALQAEQVAAARALGIDPKDYAATVKAERAREEAL